jgi:hypothetical protein
LEDFVDSLKPACSISESINKFYRLCHVLYSISALYVEAKSKQVYDENLVPIGHEFDTYLSALGLMATDVLATGNVQGPEEMYAGQLGDWLDGERYMMGLLEEDLSQLDPLHPRAQQ